MVEYEDVILAILIKAEYTLAAAAKLMEATMWGYWIAGGIVVIILVALLVAESTWRS